MYQEIFAELFKGEFMENKMGLQDKITLRQVFYFCM